jgi:translation initiation factor 1 (eIF-1/SUI1)
MRWKNLATGSGIRNMRIEVQGAKYKDNRGFAIEPDCPEKTGLY